MNKILASDINVTVEKHGICRNSICGFRIEAQGNWYTIGLPFTGNHFMWSEEVTINMVIGFASYAMGYCEPLRDASNQTAVHKILVSKIMNSLLALSI